MNATLPASLPAALPATPRGHSDLYQVDPSSIYASFKQTNIRNTYAGLDVYALVADNYACGHYRIMNPLRMLERLGANVTYRHAATYKEMSAHELVIVQRQHDPITLQGVERLLAQGRPVIYENDDFLHGIMRSSPAWKDYTPEVLRSVDRYMQICTGITVSTRELAEAYGHQNGRIIEIPNSIDFDLRDWTSFPDPYPGHEPGDCLLGWAGGTTHAEDLQLLRKVIPVILDRYPHVKFGLFTHQSLANLIVGSWGLDASRVCTFDHVPFAEYPRMLGHFDIGLAPIVDTPFNRCKSNLKVLEYGARGIPCVASRVAPYARTIDDGVNGHLAGSTDEWIDKLSDLVDHWHAAGSMGAEMQIKVKRDFDLAQNVHLWPQAWKEIVEVPLVETSEGYAPSIPAPSVRIKAGRNEACPCGSGQKYKKCACYAIGRYGR